MAAAYCLCRKPYEPNEFMIECEVCKEWFHGRCVGILEHQASDIEIYHCPTCQLTNGPLTLKKRRISMIPAFTESSEKMGKIVQTGTVSFMHELKRRTFPSADKIPVVHLDGHELTKEYFEKNGFTVPILVDKKDGLDLKVPASNFTIQDVENNVGSMREVDVIDVAHQEDCKMLMREWTEYYNSPDRRKIYNVISLEFSNTRLASLVAPPRIVTELSWVTKYWQMALSVTGEPLQKPEVHRYCLMGVKDSFTDFHIDFGGTSVWYHILKGEKVFYLIKPTQANMALYERWLSSANQSETFFGDQVDACYKCLIKQGQTLFIPTGWIHAVLTPIDSLVFGGNFLHDFNIDLQQKVSEIERRVKTQDKYLFPSYETLHWFAAKGIVDSVVGRRKSGLAIPQYLIDGAKLLYAALKSWNNKKDPAKQRLIPAPVQHTKLLKDLQKLVKELNGTVKGDKDRLGLLQPTETKVAQAKKRRFDEAVNSKVSPSKKTSPKKKQAIILKLGKKDSTVDPSAEKWEKSRVIMKPNDSALYDFEAEDDVGSGQHSKISLNPNFDSQIGLGTTIPMSSGGLGATHESKTDADVILRLKMDGNKQISGGGMVGQRQEHCSIEGGTSGINLMGGSAPPMETVDSEEELLIVDESPIKSKVPSAGSPLTTIKPASLKLKLSVNKSVSLPDSSWSSATVLPGNSVAHLATDGANAGATHESASIDYVHRLTMPVIRGGLNSSISDILEVSGYGTETDIKIDDDIGRASPTMRDAIQGMLSMSQMVRTPSLSSTSSLLSLSTKGKHGPGKSPKYDEFDFMPTCYKDDEFVYPTLDISDTEDEIKSKSRTSAKQDEAWNPKGAKLPANRLKPDRPKRMGVRKEAIESGLAAAAAKLLNRPPPKRQYNKKKPKPEKKPSLSSLSTSVVPSTSHAASIGAESLEPSTAIPASYLGALSSTKSVNLSMSPAKCKKPKKGMATAKQRLAQKLKMHKMLF